MSKNNRRWLVLVAFIAIFISGCQCSDTQIANLEIIHDSPMVNQIVSIFPTFIFHNSEGCDPDYYSIFVRAYASHGGSYNYYTPDENPTYTVTNYPLVVGQEYVWAVQANEDTGEMSEFSDPTIFFTGPLCSGEPLEAPYLVVPMEDAWITSLEYFEFRWNNQGDCLPEYYDYQFATDPGFTDVILSGTTTQLYTQHMDQTFSNCSSLFWRIRARDGNSTGPWSAGRQFHYVLSPGCYQYEYLSDDFTWIHVRLAEDQCDQTGYLASATPVIHAGCTVDGAMVVGDNSPVIDLREFEVDLGSGPCPSTGLDQKTGTESVRFGVVTPGTYCVSISRNQLVGSNNQTNLMNGIWTNPRSDQIVAEWELDLQVPGPQDVILQFNWDEYDETYYFYPPDVTYECRFGIEDYCQVFDFARAGEMVPLLGRDARSEWFLTQLNGTPCYLELPSAKVEQYLQEFGPAGSSLEDIQLMVPPDPCSLPAPCSSYGNQEACKEAGCKWDQSRVGATDKCVPK